MKAMTELKNHVADLSIDMAEKILKLELSDASKQKELITKALNDSNN
jgi:F-type H+-transporting ATPase subunit b